MAARHRDARRASLSSPIAPRGDISPADSADVLFARRAALFPQCDRPPRARRSLFPATHAAAHTSERCPPRLVFICSNLPTAPCVRRNTPFKRTAVRTSGDIYRITQLALEPDNARRLTEFRRPIGEFLPPAALIYPPDGEKFLKNSVTFRGDYPFF